MPRRRAYLYRFRAGGKRYEKAGGELEKSLQKGHLLLKKNVRMKEKESSERRGSTKERELIEGSV